MLLQVCKAACCEWSVDTLSYCAQPSCVQTYVRMCMTNSVATLSMIAVIQLSSRNLRQGHQRLMPSLRTPWFLHDCLLLLAADAIKTYVTDSHLEAQQLVQQQQAEVER